MKIFFAALIIALVSLGCSTHTADTRLPEWAVGYWVQIEDEDGRPGDDGIKLSTDGTAVVYDAGCNPLPSGSAHLYDELLYVTFTARKGPISMLYAPTADHKKLVFTSPRTGNNAVYERAISCKPAER